MLGAAAAFGSAPVILALAGNHGSVVLDCCSAPALGGVLLPHGREPLRLPTALCAAAALRERRKRRVRATSRSLVLSSLSSSSSAAQYKSAASYTE